MKRRAALAERPHKFVGKRQTDESELITEEMARTYCSNNVTTETIEKNQHLLGGFNMTQAIDECTWDVHTGQDLGWIATHKQAADSAIEIGYKRDANYTLSHIEELKEFKMQLCPFNCNGNGVCQENGTCTCDSLYFGPDCESNKSNGPIIEDIEGGGFCDQRFGSECRCFSVQTEALAESFQCKMVRQKKMLSGDTLTIGSDSTEGRYRNLYNGECCFAEGRRKRSSDTETSVLHYLYDISVSNDGMNFGPVTIVYVFDSLCLNKDTDNDGNVQFTVKADTCLIDGYCYEQNDVNISNVCFKCDPSISQYNWTQGCMASPNDDEGSLSAPTIAGIVIGVIVGIIIVTTIVVVGYKKGCKKSSVNASMEFSSGPFVSREPSRMSFNVDNLTYGQTY
ncbi:von Willebrand factor D and EGF domain-containing protein-like [Mercenaria mercenaria]|uniref:von Willebrand factor D and EGF domain-containing protein-like n=1 Tax=Mercenaria mercenaria TaxID=6596 RepID=UPI00234F129C|nr:von Willebrand factor D and EGF domain-containing protein-like [Mercenaria mercenaria]